MKRLAVSIVLLLAMSGCTLPGHEKADPTYSIKGYVPVTGNYSIVTIGATPTGTKTADGGEFIDNGCSVPGLGSDASPQLLDDQNQVVSTGGITRSSYALYPGGSKSEGCFFDFEFNQVPRSATITIKLNAFMEQRDIPWDKLICNDAAHTCSLVMRSIALGG